MKNLDEVDTFDFYKSIETCFENHPALLKKNFPFGNNSTNIC